MLERSTLRPRTNVCSPSSSSRIVLIPRILPESPFDEHADVADLSAFGS